MLLVVGRSVVGQGSAKIMFLCLETTKEAENIAKKTVLKQTEH